MNMENKSEAIEQILDIAHRHGLTPEEIDAAFKVRERDAGKLSSSVLGRILGYLGGIFIFAGLSVFIALNWNVMNTASRIIITLGSGITIFVMAIVASGDERYFRVRTPLFLIAAALQPLGILVAIDELYSVADWHTPILITAAIMFFQQGAVFWQRRDTTLLFTSVLFALWFFGITLDLLDVDEELIALVLGASSVGFCLALERTPYRGMNPFWYLVGSGWFFYGLFNMVQNTFYELIFLAMACAGVFLSTWIRSRTLLFVCTVAILSYIGYFTAEHFQDSLGWPLVLMVLGVIFIALSAVSVRISQRYIKKS